MAMAGRHACSFFVVALNCGIPILDGAFKSVVENAEEYVPDCVKDSLCAMKELTADQLRLLGIQEDDPSIATLPLLLD
jgi:hypothetical protein